MKRYSLNLILLQKQEFFDWDFDQEVRPLVTEKIEVDYGDESKLLAYLDSSNHQKSEARIKTIYYLTENYCKSFKLSIGTPLEENRPGIIEKYEIE